MMRQAPFSLAHSTSTTAPSFAGVRTILAGNPVQALDQVKDQSQRCAVGGRQLGIQLGMSDGVKGGSFRDAQGLKIVLRLNLKTGFLIVLSGILVEKCFLSGVQLYGLRDRLISEMSWASPSENSICSRMINGVIRTSWLVVSGRHDGY
jgi:hypothetical protein